jgi:hypothetical protein
MKNIIILFIFLILGAGAFYFFKQNQNPPKEIIQEQTKPTPKESVKVKETSLQAVGEFSGEATATRSYDGQLFEHQVIATLDDPAEGKFYEGWLVKSKPSLSFFSTGKMVKQSNKYYLKYTNNINKSDFNEVVITLETESLGLDGKPEAHVLEGEF